MTTEAQVSTSDPILLEGSSTDASTGELTFIGNATVLLRLGAFTVLTDPNFLPSGATVPLGGGLRSRRLRDPAMRIDELPPLDLVVLSHHHGDHFDEVASRELDRDLPIVTTWHAARKLYEEGFRRPVPLACWDAQEFRRGDQTLTITALPGSHGPGVLGAVLPPVMGSLLELTRPGAPTYRLYLTGDTLVIDDLAEIPQRHPDIDCALLHLGGTKVLGVLLSMDGEQGVECLRLVRPRHAMPIHLDDYTVQQSPLSDFTHALAHATVLPTQVHQLLRGQPTPLPGWG